MTRWEAVAFASLAGIAMLWPTSGLPAGSVHPGPLSRAEAFARADALTALGRRMFFDPSLSASGKQACSSCHDPNHAFGPASASPVEMGGPKLDRPGVRAVPSLRYLQAAPAFTEHSTTPRTKATRASTAARPAG